MLCLAPKCGAKKRAELYVVALYSLNLEDREAKANVDDLLGCLRSLPQYLLELKLMGVASLEAAEEVAIHHALRYPGCAG